MIAKIIVASKPRIIIHTLEGHGWERIVAATAHALPNPSHVIGYQHAVLFHMDKSPYYDHGGAQSLITSLQVGISPAIYSVAI